MLNSMPGGGALHARERISLRKHQKTPQQTKMIHRQVFNQHRQQQEQQAPMEQNNFQREKQHFGSQVTPPPPPSSQSKQSTTILFSRNQASGMVLPARKNSAPNIRSNACSVAATLMVFVLFVWLLDFCLVLHTNDVTGIARGGGPFTPCPRRSK